MLKDPFNLATGHISSRSTMDDHILTPRLLLTRLTDPDVNSDHCKWFYELSSDEDMMSWS